MRQEIGIQITTLNVNGLNNIIKRGGRKQNSILNCKRHFKLRTQSDRNTSEIRYTTNQKKIDNANFKVRSIRSNKGHFLMINGLIYQGYIPILNIHASNNIASK